MGKFRRLLTLLSIGLAAQVPLWAMLVRMPEELARTPMPVFAAGLFMIYMYMALRLFKRIRGLRNKETAS